MQHAEHSSGDRLFRANDIPPSVVIDMLDLAGLALIVATAMIAKLVYLEAMVGDTRASNPYLAAGLLCALFAGGLSRRSSRIPGGALDNTQIIRLFVSLALAFAFTICVGYLAKVSVHFSRGWLLTWFALAFSSLLALQLLKAPLLRYLCAHGTIARTVAVVGTEERARLLTETLGRESPWTNFRRYDLPGRTETRATEFDGLIHQARRGLVDEFVVIDDFSPEAARAINQLSALPANLHIACDRYTIELPARRMMRAGALGLVTIAEQPIGPWGQLAKRTLDVTVSGIALAALAPLMAGVALAIRLESPGPALFRQRRHGMGLRPIEVYKFRTMKVVEDGPNIKQATRGDDRITRVGQFLRRTSLDELPQLINVLRGEMSLVGPRPHALAHDQHYGALLHGYNHRLRVQPGMTGWAQIHGFRGPTPEPELMAERVRYDLEYIDNWSIWLDLQILLLTPFYGFVNRNAL